MTIKASGTISLSDVDAEFHLGKNLGAYHGHNNGKGGNFPTGKISLSDFYGASDVVAGSISFLTSQNWVVQNYNQITFKLTGAGGGGGSSQGQSGTAGGDTVLPLATPVRANGGKGGGGGQYRGINGAAGAGGTFVGGTGTNGQNGSGAAAGKSGGNLVDPGGGGAGGSFTDTSSSGFTQSGGGGGGGAETVITLNRGDANAPVAGSTLALVVGQAGSAGQDSGFPPGQPGHSGKIEISWS